MKTIILRIIISILLMLLISCSDLELEMTRKTISITVSTSGFQQQTPTNTRSNYAISNTTSTINSEFILVANTSVSWNRYYKTAFWYEDEVYDANLTNLSNDTVTLEVPLDTKLQLFVYRFQERLGLSSILDNEDSVDEYGISDTFYISSEDRSDEVTIDVGLFTLKVEEEEEEEIVEEEEEIEIEEELEEEEDIEIEIEEEETHGEEVYDYDGNRYDVVKWNNRKWLKQNLRVTHYSNGDNISFYSDWWANYPNSIDFDNFTSKDMYTYFEPEEGYDYDNYVEEFGLLYNYYTYHGDKDPCPSGWEMPTPEDWGLTTVTRWTIADALFLTAGGMGDAARSMLYDERIYGYWSADKGADEIPDFTPAYRYDDFEDFDGHEVIQGQVSVRDVTSIRCVKDE